MPLLLLQLPLLVRHLLSSHQMGAAGSMCPTWHASPCYISSSAAADAAVAPAGEKICCPPNDGGVISVGSSHPPVWRAEGFTCPTAHTSYAVASAAVAVAEVASAGVPSAALSPHH